jgi:hypothetical protein
MPRGIDMPIDAGSHIEQIANAGIEFIGRYYRNPHSKWAPLSNSEAQVISKAGLKVVALWEYQSDHSSYFTHLQGVDDATSAYNQANKIGQPPGTPIYFCVDFDATKEVTGKVVDYFAGIEVGFNAAGRGNAEYLVGVYGSGFVCSSLLTSHLVQYTWVALSTGWTGSKTFKDWSIQQSKGLPEFDFNHDADQAVKDYGGFSV